MCFCLKVTIFVSSWGYRDYFCKLLQIRVKFHFVQLTPKNANSCVFIRKLRFLKAIDFPFNHFRTCGLNRPDATGFYYYKKCQNCSTVFFSRLMLNLYILQTSLYFVNCRRTKKAVRHTQFLGFGKNPN